MISLCLTALAMWSQPSDSLSMTGPLKWLERVHDFGAFSEDDEQINCKFRFVNVGSEPVTILQAAATCGCTVPSYTTDAIAPGDTASINVRFNPVGQAGRFEKSIYVRTNVTHERIRLTIRGAVIGNERTVSKKYPVDMGALKLRNGVVMIGKVTQGKGKTAYLDGYNKSNDTIRPVIENLPKYIQASVTPEIVPPGELVSFSFYFQGEKCKEWGLLNDTISIRPNIGDTPHPMSLAIIVEEDFSNLSPAELETAPKLSQDVDRIDLGQVELNSTTPVTAKMRLTNTGQKPLKIHRIYTTDPGISINSKSESIKPGKSTELEVTFDPSVQPTGIINAKFTLITNDPSAPTRTIRIVGTRK